MYFAHHINDYMYVDKLHRKEHYKMSNVSAAWKVFRTPINHQADDENYFVHTVSFH